MPRWPQQTTIDRLLRHVLKTDGCWLWMAGLRKDGYGRFWNGQQMTVAHKVAYELMVGRVPVGMELDHLCRNRACVNPQHLEPVTRRINVLRGASKQALNARKTHCAHGHPFNEENTYLRSSGWRGCRACNYIAVKRYKQRITA